MISEAVKSKASASACDIRESSDKGNRETYGGGEEGLPQWSDHDSFSDGLIQLATVGTLVCFRFLYKTDGGSNGPILVPIVDFGDLHSRKFLFTSLFSFVKNCSSKSGHSR